MAVPPAKKLRCWETPLGSTEKAGTLAAGTTATPPPGEATRAAPALRRAWSRVVRISASVISPVIRKETSPLTWGSMRNGRLRTSPSTASTAAGIGARSIRTLTGIRWVEPLVGTGGAAAMGGPTASSRQPWRCGGGSSPTRVAAAASAAGEVGCDCGRVALPPGRRGSLAQALSSISSATAPPRIALFILTPTGPRCPGPPPRRPFSCQPLAYSH